MEQLETADIMEAIKELNDGRAVASDGWKVQGMKKLPEEIVHKFTILLRNVKQGGERPTFMKEVYTTMIEQRKIQTTWKAMQKRWRYQGR